VIARLAERAAIRVDAFGFPRALDTPAHSDTLHVEALVSAWTGMRGKSLVLDVKTARPRAADGWKGMSGAAVFAGDRLAGVVEAVPAELGDGTLRATRADLLFNDDAARSILDHADVRLTDRVVDAAYVDSLPRAGHWGGVRERYTRAVVTMLCRIDHVGLAVGGVAERRTPALAAFTAQRLSAWPDEGPARADACGRDGDGCDRRLVADHLSRTWPPSISAGTSCFAGRNARRIGTPGLPAELVATLPRVLIVGEGGGKSTMLKQLLARAAAAGKVPVWVSIAQLPADAPLTIPTLVDHLVREAQARLGVAEVNASSSNLYGRGRLAIGFDALDECGSQPQRQQCAD
jgi:hypothetical protein